MALGKMLNLGGMENSPPKTNQDIGRFRVARNVIPTINNTIIPRYDVSEPAGQPNSIGIVHHITQYDGDVFSVVSNTSTGLYEFYRNYVKIPETCFVALSPVGSQVPDFTQSVQSYRVNNTLYILFPFTGNFVKYDGVEMAYAGVNDPLVSSPSYLAAGTRFIRVVPHTMDFDNNEPMGSFLEFPTNSTSVEIRTDGGSSPLIGKTNVYPATYLGSSNGGEIYFKNGQSSYDSINKQITIVQTASRSGTVSGIPSQIISIPSGTSDLRVGMKVTGATVPSGTYITVVSSPTDITVSSIVPLGTQTLSFPLDTNISYQNQVGAYVFCCYDYSLPLFLGINSSLTPYEFYSGLALKVKSVSPLVLDVVDAYLMDKNGEWIKQDISAYLTVSNVKYIEYGTRTFCTAWESVSHSGIYYYRNTFPTFPASSTYSFSIVSTTGTSTGVAPLSNMFSITSTLNDMYDVNTRKLSPNSFYNFGPSQFFCMTKYQGLLVLANSDYIWFSDTSSPGAIEQFRGSSYIQVGDREFGRITCICATNDFIFVGRERKNYYVLGNISTGNYKVQEISDMPVGPWCNSSAILIKDSVVFINTLGVFSLSTGGKVDVLSKKITKNFSEYSSYPSNEDVVFKMPGDSYTVSFSTITNVGTAYGLAVAYDAFRELLVFMKRDPYLTLTNPCLVLCTKTGEFYEWDAMISDTDLVGNCISFINSEMYVGTTSMDITYTIPAKIKKEDKQSIRNYPTTSPVKLYTTWMTAGEPSLEKELLQLKIFGRINNTIKVLHYKDWNIQNLVTNTTYVPITTSPEITTQTQYSHKKRLTSDKCLAASVGIEVTSTTSEFEIESFEVEFNAIQSGMKR